jgi:methionine sulfoxide reductase catalytic subunit
MTFPNDVRESQITPEALWVGRRRWLRLMGSAALLPFALDAWGAEGKASKPTEPEDSLAVTPEAAATTYNNYYEFSFEKSGPSGMADALQLSPWTIEVTGLVEKPLKIGVEDLGRKFSPVDRIYRFRCVEGWSAVLPWTGILLRDVILAANPLPSARYVAFTSVAAPEAMPNQKMKRLLDWPYREALRLDEALHPLSLLATGLYGKSLPAQNGAPIRLVIPWKYGFKSAKAIVRIELQETQPITTWNQQAPDEYGFYANVNPDVPHPRWSQATERPLGRAFYQPRSPTRLFNGYENEVGSLYAGLDLHRNF